MTRPTQRRGFSLIELLVVVVILGVLIAILLASLGKASDAAKSLACQANLRSIMTAASVYAHDNNESLMAADPQQTSQYADGSLCAIPDWLNGMNGLIVTTNSDFAPPGPGTDTGQPGAGSLYPYLNQQGNAYRCPSLAVGKLHSGQGSNGMFDYVFYAAFSGARLNNIGLNAKIASPSTPGEFLPDQVYTPIFCEEDPAHYLNTAQFLEGAHANQDQMAHTHQGMGNYATIDGSLHSYAEPSGVSANSWYSQTPGGTWMDLGNYNSEVGPGRYPFFGWWNQQ